MLSCDRAQAVVLVLLSLSAAGRARAATATGTLTVSITITAACTISSTATLAFGSVTGASLATTDATTSTTISVTCTSSAPFSIGMGLGANSSASQRRMASAVPAYINYGLYQSSGTSTPWTSATSSTACTTAGDCVLGTGTGSAASYTIWGDVPSGQSAAAGYYSDSVTMTITY